LLIGSFAAGSPMTWASPPAAANEGDPASPERAVSGYERGAAAAAAPAAAALGPVPQINFDARLVGTAVVEGGLSVALLQLAGGTRIVREGDEIVAGMRLVKVWRNRIDVERAGIRQDIRQTSNGGPLIDGQAAPADVDHLWQSQGRMGRSLFYSHYRRAQN
jgi:hypothetical protein